MSQQAKGLFSFIKYQLFPFLPCLMQLVHEKIHRQFFVFQKINSFFSQVQQEVKDKIGYTLWISHWENSLVTAAQESKIEEKSD